MMQRLRSAAAFIAIAAVPAILIAQDRVRAGKAAAPPAAATQAATPVSTAPAAAKAAAPAEIRIERESFTYTGGGRRDPYQSLMRSGDIRPLLSDLKLTAIAFDPDGNNSVAILRDVNTQEQYRVRVGQQLGRMRVSAIRQKAVQFTIEEFGFNRQETLTQSSDSTKVRNP
jgi:hypothetical protein